MVYTQSMSNFECSSNFWFEAAKMSSGDGRIVSSEDIQMVQNRIEQCLRHYMSQKEVLETLFIQDKIEPGFTELVWLKLEEENQEFFQAYHLKLMVKEQIMEFNRLLAEQVKMTHQLPREIPQNFGLSGLSTDFSNSSDILESYSRTSFLATDTGNLLDPNGDIERLTNASDSLQYEGFAGD
ncbi:uncharacterized protein [Nicotiana tomentosiformis]|uniref:uncharacterized protein isoform X5 n=1 Tax=Nicotiana tomentosiformis TaxID=4098 RepID=UPI00051BCBC2|nr:uncharacterized protein LOC104113755 isoform X6 [Nicotiana tomentosiformis]